MSTLHDQIIQIQVLREQLRYHHPDIDTRLVRWGLAVVDAKRREWLLDRIQNRPEKEQWWWVRQFLPDAAIPCLVRKLTELTNL